MARGSGSASGSNWFSQGAGPGLLFVHGAGGNAAVWWEQVAQFAATHRVVTLDLPGFGRAPAAPGAEFADHFAEAVRQVMDAAGLASASLVCQSLGGWYGLRFALAYPERVQHLVLSCTMAGIAHPPALAAFQQSLSKMDDRGPASIALGRTFRQRFPVKDYLYQQIGAFNPGLSPDAAKQIFSDAVLLAPDRLQAVACPVLIISGSEDDIWPPESLQGLLDAFPDARLEVVPECGHSPYFEQPDVFERLVREFLNGG